MRYNPDAFKVGGVTRRTSKRERAAKLLMFLGGLMASETELPFQRGFLFYDREAADSALPLVSEHWGEVVRAVSRCGD